MVKRLLIAALLATVLTLPAYAADTASADSIGDIEQILNRLQNQPGLYGATGSEMNAFLDMVQTPELASVVARLSAELHEQGDVENLTLEQVSAFVRQRLTLEDAERLLNQDIKEDEFHRALQAGGNSQNLDMLVEMLRAK